jgi:hypothetical protein
VDYQQSAERVSLASHTSTDSSESDVDKESDGKYDLTL